MKEKKFTLITVHQKLWQEVEMCKKKSHMQRKIRFEKIQKCISRIPVHVKLITYPQRVTKMQTQ